MTVKKFGRRMFLGTLGGGLLAMPFLPSILHANDRATGALKPRTLVTFATGHGGVMPWEFFPDFNLLDRTESLHTWQSNWGQTRYSKQGNNGHLSNVVQGRRLTPELAAKFSFLMGVDYTPQYIGHQSASYLGGYAQGLHDKLHADEFSPTIDQIIGHSKTMYPQAPSHRVVNINHNQMSWYHLRANDKKSPMVARPGYSSPSALWNALFEPGGSDSRDSDREWIVDKAVASYKNLTKSASAQGRRLSTQDKQRLDMHMNSLFEIQKQIVQANQCGARPERPTNPPLGGIPIETWQLYAKMIQAAVLCDISRVFTISTPGGAGYTSAGRNFHQAVAHTLNPSSMQVDGATREARRRHTFWYQQTFEHTILPVVEALNIDDGLGNTILDESMVWWTSECGVRTHNSIGIPLLTAGGLGGKLNMGRFIDYRDRANMTYARGNSDLTQFLQPGLPYDQMLGTILQGFDTPLEDYDVYRLRESFTRDPSKIKGPVIIGGYGGYRKEGVKAFGYRPDWVHAEDVRLGADKPMPLLWDA